MRNFKNKSSVVLLLALTTLTACHSETEKPLTQTPAVKDTTTSAQWFKQGKQRAQNAAPAANTQAAKNLILIVGDGMGITTHTAARIYAGQQQELLGEEYTLSFETLPYSALIKTYNTDQQTPDSAGTMSALITGEKTRAGVLSVNHTAKRGDCQSSTGQHLKTLFDLAESQNKATGIVTTARVTHATPAALYAHSPERGWESDNKLSAEAKQNGCIDIAQQLINHQQGEQRLEVIFGGGQRHFLPASEPSGKRTDQQNLTTQWQSLPDHYLVSNKQQLRDADLTHGHWLGLFADSHLPYVDQRDEQTPGLLDMTQAALTRLQQNPDGYVLMIESGRIDHGHHAGSGYQALRETQELDQTVAWLLKQIDLDNTLLIVTADHSHTLTLAGYPTRGNPMLGVVTSNNDQGRPEEKPYRLPDGGYYTSMNYRNGPGAVEWQSSSQPAPAKRPSVDPQQALQPGYLQQALVPLESETHGGEDVALYAAGPWAHLFGGTLEQHWVYHVMRHALLAEEY